LTLFEPKVSRFHSTIFDHHLDILDDSGKRHTLILFTNTYSE